MGLSSIGASLINGAMNTVSTASTNAVNYKIAQMNNDTNREINKENNQFNAEQAELDRQFQADEAQKNRDFNSLQSQVAQAKEAGINPNAIVGNGGTSTASPTGSTASASPAAPQVAPQMEAPQFDVVADIAKMAQAKNTQALTENQLKQNELLEIQKTHDIATLRSKIDLYEQNLKNAKLTEDEKRWNVVCLQKTAQQTATSITAEIHNAYMKWIDTNTSVEAKRSQMNYWRGDLIAKYEDYVQRENFYANQFLLGKLDVQYKYGSQNTSNSSYQQTHVDKSIIGNAWKVGGTLEGSAGGTIPGVASVSGHLAVTGEYGKNNVDELGNNEQTGFGDSSVTHSRNEQMADEFAKCSGAFRALSRAQSETERANCMKAIQLFDLSFEKFKILWQAEASLGTSITDDPDITPANP